MINGEILLKSGKLIWKIIIRKVVRKVKIWKILLIIIKKIIWCCWIDYHRKIKINWENIWQNSSSNLYRLKWKPFVYNLRNWLWMVFMKYKQRSILIWWKICIKNHNKSLMSAWKNSWHKLFVKIKLGYFLHSIFILFLVKLAIS